MQGQRDRVKSAADSRRFRWRGSDRPHGNQTRRASSTSADLERAVPTPEGAQRIVNVSILCRDRKADDLARRSGTKFSCMSLGWLGKPLKEEEKVGVG